MSQSVFSKFSCRLPKETYFACCSSKTMMWKEVSWYPIVFESILGASKVAPTLPVLHLRSLLKKNPTCTSDMTLQNILQNMYMDDLIFSVDSLESAQTITNEAVSLFKSRGFKLVKWSANRDTMSVLSSLGPELFVSFHTRIRIVW